MVLYHPFFIFTLLLKLSLLKVLLLDNYDSFTYNLVHYVEGFDIEVDVIFNDQINLALVNDYDKIILSPGPGLPVDAGKLMQVIEEYATIKPIFGVCLGFQALAEYFGGNLYNQTMVKHGVAEYANFDLNSRLFSETAERFSVGLYHSWAVEKNNFPKSLDITAESENGVIMAFEHKTLPLTGVQFHPESILSQHGKKIVENFLFKFN